MHKDEYIAWLAERIADAQEGRFNQSGQTMRDYNLGRIDAYTDAKAEAGKLDVNASESHDAAITLAEKIETPTANATYADYAIRVLEALRKTVDDEAGDIGVVDSRWVITEIDNIIHGLRDGIGPGMGLDEFTPKGFYTPKVGDEPDAAGNVVTTQYKEHDASVRFMQALNRVDELREDLVIEAHEHTDRSLGGAGDVYSAAYAHGLLYAVLRINRILKEAR